ncbi:hypothetical protein J5N97_004609 [Dioscorea zingiberensis]|uniref:Uncharacterized protein n=1 Tax=Dioscorea zingiberensis TaxID=325984 RepID=A0A9D5HRG2_9LILI|nr:hypothetical protein J5N97_004609 [Dioscorea zingiberensis]
MARQAAGRERRVPLLREHGTLPGRATQGDRYGSGEKRAEKKNKVVLVEEMKLTVEKRGYIKGMVTAEEVETRVRWLMESDGGKELRERAKEMKHHAAAALSDGGSSHAAIVELISEWKCGMDGINS